MNDDKVSAIVISSRDYKEKDKLVELFTLEDGIKTVVLKGVKNANAKYKFAKEPFCFGEFVLTGQNEIKVVSQANLIDSFFDITKIYERYVIGCKILSIIPKLIIKSESNSALFLNTLKALRELSYSKTSELEILCSFIVKALCQIGYKINVTSCSTCGSKFVGKIYLNLENADIVCQNCRAYLSVEISPAIQNALRILFDAEYEQINTVNLDEKILMEVLKVLQILMQNKIDSKISLLKF